MQLAHPRNLVVAEDVDHGKPDPQSYLLGAERLGLRPDARLLVIEDAPSGVQAGKAANFAVIALATTHDVSRLRNAGADWIVKDMRSITLKAWDGARKEASIEIADALR